MQSWGALGKWHKRAPMRYLFNDESNCSWFGVLLLLAKECLLSVLYQKRGMLGFPAPAARLTVC